MDFILKSKCNKLKIRNYNFSQGKVVSVTNEVDIADLLKNSRIVPVGAVLLKSETMPIIEKKAKDGQLRIGALRVGGLGDTLQLGAHACAIKRKFPGSFLTVYVRDKICIEVMEFNKWVDKVCMVGVQNWDQIIDREKVKHDIFYDFRYAVKVIFNTSKYPDYEAKTAKIFEDYKTIYKDFCKSNYQIEKYGLNLIDFSNKIACLDGSEDDMNFELNDNFRGYAKVLEKQKYITIHIASGKFRKTKSWLIDRWLKTVEYLIHKGYTVIQIGDKSEPVIEGALDLRGLIIQETAWILYGAQYHIDAEGGVVHLAKAVKTPSIVIFGCTPVECFGYKGNINLRSKDCPPCWYKTEDWYLKCPEGHENPKCLELITVGNLKNAIDEFDNKYKEKRVKPIKIKETLVSIVMPVHNQLKYLQTSISSILNSTKIDFELIVVDNGSGQEVKEYLNGFKQSKMVKIITNEKNLGFSKANNQGAKQASGEYLCLINSDIKVGEGWLKALVDGFNSESGIGMVGVAGGRLDSECRCCGVVRKNDQPYNYLEGWCLLIKRSIFSDLGGFDEDFTPAFSEDADLSFRLKRSGHKTKIIEGVAIQHYGNKTVFTQQDFDVTKVSKENSQKLKEKMKGIKKGIVDIKTKTKF